MNLAIEINTLVTRANVEDLPALRDLVIALGAKRWNVHFLVPLPASAEVEMLTAAEVENVFAFLASPDDPPLPIRVIEAPHFRRFLVQKENRWPDFEGYEERRPIVDVVRDGSFVFISQTGDVRPSEFLPFAAGNLRRTPLAAIIECSALYSTLRDSRNLKGKCRDCEYVSACGGSRARAWAASGDLFAADPLCAYQPGV
jgi:radical SAM protein with 4Fe4S-binding SPASM domain